MIIYNILPPTQRGDLALIRRMTTMRVAAIKGATQVRAFMCGNSRLFQRDKHSCPGLLSICRFARSEQT